MNDLNKYLEVLGSIFTSPSAEPAEIDRRVRETLGHEPDDDDRKQINALMGSVRDRIVETNRREGESADKTIDRIMGPGPHRIMSGGIH